MKITALALALAVPALAAAETPAAGQTPAVQAPATGSAADPSADLGALIIGQSKVEMDMIALQNPAPADKSNISQLLYLVHLCHSATVAATETAKGITSFETAEANALELGARCNVYVGISMAGAIVGQSMELTDEEAEQLKPLADEMEAADLALAQELRRLRENDYYGSDYLKAIMAYLKTSAVQTVEGAAE